LIVPDSILLFLDTYTDLLSPVILDVSMFVSPSSTIQSNGIISPGFINILSPTFTFSTSTSFISSFLFIKFAIFDFISTISFMFLF